MGLFYLYYTVSGIIFVKYVDNIPERVYNKNMETNIIANCVRQKRKKLGLTQQEFAMRSGLGLRFIRELEQGKQTVRLDKVNQALKFLSLKIEVVEDDE